MVLHAARGYKIVLAHAAVIFAFSQYCYVKAEIPGAMVVLDKKMASENLAKAFQKFHAIGILMTPEWIVTSMYHLRAIKTSSNGITADDFVIMSLANTDNLAYFREARLIPVDEIILSPDYHWDAYNCIHDGFFLRLAEKVPYGVSYVQPKHYKTNQLNSNSYMISIHFSPPDKFVWARDKIYVDPEQKNCKGEEYLKLFGYCSMLVRNNLACDSWFHGGALLLNNNKIIGMQIKGGDCALVEKGVDYNYQSLALDQDTYFGKLMSSTLFDRKMPPFPIALTTRASATRRKHIIKTSSTRKTTPTPTGPFNESNETTTSTIDSTRRRIFRPTPPLQPLHWKDRDLEDCDQIDHALIVEGSLILVLAEVILFLFF